MANLKPFIKYVGGKQLLLKQLKDYLPTSFSEYREPMVGGGAMFFYIRQTFPEIPCWINDKWKEIYCLYEQIQNNTNDFVLKIQNLMDKYRENKKELYYYCKNWIPIDNLEIATRYFITNKISFNGQMSGGYTQKDCEKYFFSGNVLEKIYRLSILLKNVKITNLDYSEVIRNVSDTTFCFFDPPYRILGGMRYYGNKGELHKNFDFERFQCEINQLKSKFMITFDLSQKDKYSNFNCKEIPVVYSAHGRRDRISKKEIVIFNY